MEMRKREKYMESLNDKTFYIHYVLFKTVAKKMYDRVLSLATCIDFGIL